MSSFMTNANGPHKLEHQTFNTNWQY